ASTLLHNNRGKTMNYCQELLERYKAFYRAEYRKNKGFSAQGCVKPMDLATEILLKNPHTSLEETQDMISARLSGLMSQIHKGTAEGRWVVSGQEEVEAIQEFARFFVFDFFVKGMNNDRANLAGNRHRLIINTCEFLYRRMEDALRKEVVISL